MNYKIVTTLGPGGWELYGKRFAESFKKYWPANARLEIWTHDLGDNPPFHPGITFKRLDDTEGFKAIKQMLGNDATNGPTLQYSFKAVALAEAMEDDLDWIGFVDADTETMQPVDDALLNALFDPAYHLTYLYRRGIRESEGSWFAFNVATERGSSLLADYYGLYRTGEFLHYIKKHDNAVLDRLVTIHQAHGLRVNNLAPGALGLDAFHQSPLGAYMVHYKGPDKNTIANPALGAPGRYQTLCEILCHSIVETGKANIVEVGTWNGSRAIQLAEAAFALGTVKRVQYIGFDTFEDGNDRAHEGHTKPHAQFNIVEKRLENYRKLVARQGKIFDYSLVQGNTLTTLPAFKEITEDSTFAYIDGGHSLETTQSDYNCLKHIPYIVFDDVIAQPEPGAPEGPREVWQKAEGNRQLYQSFDGYAGLKQTISFGVVTKPPYKTPDLRQQIVVKPVDSVEKSEQYKFIAENTTAIKEWLETAQAHGRNALLVSAGPTLKDYLDDIRTKQAMGSVVFAVKHAYPILKAAGITPDFLVVLDPRPLDDISTHGVLRSTLFTDMEPGEKVLLATMTHPSVRRNFEERGARIIGWHAHTQASQAANLPELKKGLTVGGGTCTATRLITLAFVLGFRRFDFYGYDFYYDKDVDRSTIKQQLIEVSVGQKGKSYLTTGELIAAMQDMGIWNKWLLDNRITVKWHGDGAGRAVWESTVHNYEAPGEYPY